MGIDFAQACRHDGRMRTQADSDPWLRVIAFFKLIKAVLFTAAGIGVLNLFHKDIAGRVQQALDHLHVDPDNRYAQEFLAQLGRMTDTNMKLLGISLISFFYAALFGTEGIGLFPAQALGRVVCGHRDQHAAAGGDLRDHPPDQRDQVCGPGRESRDPGYLIVVIRRKRK